MKHVRTDPAFGLPRVGLGEHRLATPFSDADFDRPPRRRACPYCGDDHYDEEFDILVPCGEVLERLARRAPQ